ncbi:oxidoreductase [Rhodovibrio sodomensis]|uniref:Oxidoreductase n=1 Tax=Rhodovibrio sodomensis TaxID=1088 RepID=A0ABS1DG13_9PROT|nr:MDR family oxidoreductase [Rhodovibrio sodomensis]MBK1669400.1 oxidoreductase [Rhodovibrio sodomensis]
MAKALIIDEEGAEPQVRDIDAQQIKDANTEGDVTVRVTHTTLNYKDGMVLNSIGKLARSFPHVPGIDFAGTVEESDHPAWTQGDAVILTGWRVGEATWGGYAELARVKGDWLVAMPRGLTAERAMAIGTAGFTAMLAILELEDHGLSPTSEGEVLVTGAAGGVGSIATACLARRGYSVAAVTGRPESHAYLTDLGASRIVDRSELNEPSKRPLEKETWAACIDAVGGPMLGRVLGQMRYRGSVAAVGLAGGNELNTTVLPFLLRGVNLLGIDSVMCAYKRREAAWRELARDLPMDKLDAMTSTASLDELPKLGKDILKGQVQGRVVVAI